MANKKTKQKAKEFALEKFDYVIDEIETPDYIELVGSVGGDILRYRVYENFIGEK